VTLAVDDVLLGALLGRLEGVALGRVLLLGASVYREAVDEVGLAWQVGDEVEVPADPEREARSARLAEARSRAASEGRPGAGLADLGLPEEEVRQIEEDSRRGRVPPLRVPEGLGEAVAALEDLGLLAPVEGEEGRQHLVHRWTAGALAGLASAEELAEAHRRAAGYWSWRVRVWPQSRQRDVEQVVEARHHLHAAGDLAGAVAATEAVVTQLHTWGAWAWEERLCLETLGWLPEGSREAAAYQHQLGMVAQERGDYEHALGWYRRSLAISEELGDRARTASSYHQLGTVAHVRGDYEAALDWYRRSLAIEEELGDRAGMASSYHQLGIVAEERGDYDAALDWYRRSLDIFEELGDRASMASSYHQLGIVAQLRGDYEPALDWYRRSLAILEELGDRASMASSHHQLGMVAELRGDYEGALDWYRRSLDISEELGNRAGTAGSYHQMGVVAYLRGDYEGALDWYRRSLAIEEELGDRSGMAMSHHQLGMVAQERGDYDGALDWYRRSLAISEELGNRGGMATSTSQIGVLLTETGRPAEAVPFNLRALSFRLTMLVPEARIDIHWLGRQRTLLGPKRFLEVVRGQLDEDSTTALMQLLEQSDP
jgi:tetratricopeptide (TPR) repeat protein